MRKWTDGILDLRDDGEHARKATTSLENKFIMTIAQNYVQQNFQKKKLQKQSKSIYIYI